MALGEVNTALVQALRTVVALHNENSDDLESFDAAATIAKATLKAFNLQGD